MNHWTRLGIEAYRAGNRPQAQRFFRYALMEKPDDIKTWLWMVEVAETDAERQRCLEQVLALDPENLAASRALQVLQAHKQSTGMPHVSPFSEDQLAAPASGQLPASTPIASTPPFMVAMTARIQNETVVAAPSARGGGRRRWLLAAGVLLGLVLLAAGVLLLVRPF